MPPRGAHKCAAQRRDGRAVNKPVIVTESRRPSKDDVSPRARPHKPHPLVGAQFVIGAAKASQLPPPGVPEIAFAGRSNAGKSSAINALANRTRLAYASRTPGRTQQINLFALRSGALVADLPGYGYAAVARSVKRGWQEFLWQYVSTRSSLVALVMLIDARHGLKELDLEVLAQFVPSGRPVLLLATKADKLTTTGRRAAVASVATQLDDAFPFGAPQITIQLFSAVTRLGVPEAESTIASWLPEAAIGASWQNTDGEQAKKGPATRGSGAGP
ncbi:MAG: YihA family ribosome biogenesis GTP-binding protein [Burkholderiales bacterium]|nr:YihA family ribosome biogenesis GTP-binding protein [Burkholderiales bacterium]